MQPTLCARCHKNMAVVFINRIENGQSHQEGLCLKCARELHIKPIDDIISKMGINDEDLDGLSSEMMEAMQNLSGKKIGSAQQILYFFHFSPFQFFPYKRTAYLSSAIHLF